VPRPPRLAATAVAGLLAQGALVIDTRAAADFAAGHLPGTISIPLDQSFTTWAGWLVPYDRPVALLIDERDPQALATALGELARIGLDRVAGMAGRDVLDSWLAAGQPLATTATVTPAEAALLQREGAAVIDVRGLTEWEAGHLPGAPNLPLGWLRGRLADVPRNRPLVVYCQTGARSAIAASLLQAHGYDEVANLAGGMAAWRAAGLPIAAGAGVPVAA
jgi:hydroxyacylglutathione hydrolase